MRSRLAPTKPIGLGTHSGKSAASGAAGVDIEGFPQLVYTRTVGDPDTLFVPLLDASREGYRLVEHLCSQGEKRGMAVTLSAMQLATSLLQDPSFTVVVKGPPHETMYSVDLESGTMHLGARLFASVSHRTSFFKVEIAGKIADGQFVVRNPTQNRVVTQVSEEEIRTPGFFSKSLAQQCLRAQIKQEEFGTITEAASTDAHGEIRLTVPVASGKAPVLLQQKEPGGAWRIVDGRAKETMGTLPPEMEGHLGKVFDFLEELLGKR